MDWKVGDKVFFVERGYFVGEGCVLEIYDKYVEIKEKYGSIGRAKKDMFRTRKEAEREAERRREEVKDKYRKGITSKESLISFIFNKCGNFEEYTNHEANEVGREKVREMFGFDVEE